MRYKILFFCFFLTSCIKEIDINLQSETPKVVVSCLFTKGKIVAFVSESKAITENVINYLPDAIVLLAESTPNNIIDTLHQIELGKYESTFSVYQTNAPYFITVIDPKLGVVTANSYLPSSISIGLATFRFPAGYDRYGDPYREVTVEIHDEEMESNYYELYIFVPFRGKIYYYTNEFVAESDPVILAEGLEGFENTSFLFSDKLFEGKSYTLRLKFESMIAEGDGIESHTGLDETYYVAVRTVSKEYYDFRKSWISHRYHQQTKPAIINPDVPLFSDYVNFLFKGEAQSLYTNIENGYGFFAGYNESIVRLEEVK